MDQVTKKKFNAMKPLSISGILLGVGMGGFVDGIVFHQIMQIHNMLSNKYFPDTLANEQLNMVWDGVFHAFTWTITAYGLVLLWKLARNGVVPLITNFFVGSMILGWGLFNLIEGIVDHHILQVHHVVQRSEGTEQLFWDLAFLASGAVFIALGTMMRHRAIKTTNDVIVRAPSSLNSTY
jgi:uncharacterized membrane protein